MANRLKNGWMEYLNRKIAVFGTSHLFYNNRINHKIYTITTCYGLIQAIMRVKGRFMVFFNSVLIFQEDQYIESQSCTQNANQLKCLDQFNVWGVATEGEGIWHV